MWWLDKRGWITFVNFNLQKIIFYFFIHGKFLRERGGSFSFQWKLYGFFMHNIILYWLAHWNSGRSLRKNVWNSFTKEREYCHKWHHWERDTWRAIHPLWSLETGHMLKCRIGRPESAYFLEAEKWLQSTVLTAKPESIGSFINLL